MYPLFLMRKTVLTFFVCLISLIPLSARDYFVRGPQGGLSAKITLPKGFNPETDRCPMVILMHGIFASKEINPMPDLAAGLAKAGIASIRFDPKDPPEYIRCWGFMKLGRNYLLGTQALDIYGTASAYPGKVLILHGTKDKIVPMWCSEKFKETYGDQADFVVIDGENHTITRHRDQVVANTVEFFRKELLRVSEDN